MKLALALASAFAPGLALACPSCARDNVPHAALFIAGMIAVPYLVAVVAVRAIRGADGPRPGGQP